MRFGLTRLVPAGLSLLVLALSQPGTNAASTYLTPPQVIVDILEARPLPQAVVSPERSMIALLERPSMPSIAEMAQPMLRLAGQRIDPKTNGIHRSHNLDGILLKRVRDGGEVRVKVPPGSKLGSVRFSPDGKELAFTRAVENGIELWVAATSTGAAHALTGPELNGTAGDPCEWQLDSAALLCSFVFKGRGAPPPAPSVPTGPTVQENLGKTAPVRTYQDLLDNADDEALFDYYFTSQLAWVTVLPSARGHVEFGKPGIFVERMLSPNSQYVLVSRVKRPYSYLVPADDFPKDVEIWDGRGAVLKKIADLPLADTVPMGGVPTGPRAFTWRPDEPATLNWIEALDEGNPKNKVLHRDKVLALKAPFADPPAEVARTEFRSVDLAWTDRGVGLLSEYDRATRWTRTFILDGPSPRKLWDRSAEDRYGDPGTPLRRPAGRPTNPFAASSGAVLQSGDSIFLTGAGASPEGDRPFLDKLNLKTLASERLFRTDDKSYETVVTVLADDGSRVLTRYETKTDPPNYGVRAAAQFKPLTAYPDPAPQLTGIEKQLITYQRSDGVKLSATLYLPAGHKQGERLPLVMWAYPREFTDPNAAGQVTGSAHRFTLISGPSHLLFLTQGYAVLDDPAMPIVGKEETANDTYVEQLVANAQAAVDKVVDMGVADRSRIAIGGHSYGAFMTANLLAHSDLFRAGIARSGAYNRTLTPFGFQNEMRSFWEVPQIYARMSPFWYAHKIREPILLIHGEADNNSGTFPIQSERFYMALKGHGATVRYVTLPHEAHGYAGRESVLHTVAEMLSWCDKYVKNAAPTPTTSNGDGR